jgi:iron complex outermembrane receptor protein
MDLVGNKSDGVNANYTRQFAWGDLDTRVYWQQVNHEMGFFSPEKTGNMPMKTDAKDYGYAIKASIPLTEVHLLRIGNEFHKNTLDDFWPPVPGDVMMMGPNTYVNINNGRRDRFGVFAEVESRWSQAWTTLLGIRDDYVKTSTGEVQSYGGMMNAVDIAAANAFNAADRSKSDNHVDLTATTKYEPSTTKAFEFGYARKTRSPSLYERYTWGRGTMAATMTGWFGDANGYVGDPNLKPETANTISAGIDMHDANRESWQFKVTPYYTYVQDYIGVETVRTFAVGGDTRSVLQFDNQDAQFYGINAAWKLNLWDNGQFGKGRINSSLAWTRGARTNGDDLYHIMPLNARVSLEQRVGAWANAVDLQVVDSKTRVDDARSELKTAGYSLVNLRSSYQWTKVRIDMSVTNLFDKFYYQPLGGVNYANWNANGAIGSLGSVAGIGRSFNAGLTIDF